jgi:hypothetical protein
MTRKKQISKELEVTCYQHATEFCVEDSYTGDFSYCRLYLNEVLELKCFLDGILKEHCDD